MKRVPRRWYLAATLLSVGAALMMAGSRGGGPTPVLAQAEPEPIPIPVVLVFGPGADRTQDGWVMVTRAPRSRQTGVQIELAPLVMAPQNAMIVKGTCEEPPGDVMFELNPVVAGESITTVDVSRRLLFDGTMSIRIQGTDSDPTLYTACVLLPLRHDALGGGPHRNEPKPPPPAD